MPVEVLSHRKRAGEGDRYRPGAQQRQFDSDNFFEFRFDAYLTCKNIITGEYQKVLRAESEKLLESIKNDTRAAAHSVGDKLHMTCISTGLSEADRPHLIDATVAMLEAEALVIEISNAYASAHDILVEAAENSYETCRKQFVDTRSRGRGGDNKQLDQLAKTQSTDQPIEMIRTVYKVSQHTTLVRFFYCLYYTNC